MFFWGLCNVTVWGTYESRKVVSCINLLVGNSLRKNYYILSNSTNYPFYFNKISSKIWPSFGLFSFFRIWPFWNCLWTNLAFWFFFDLVTLSRVVSQSLTNSPAALLVIAAHVDSRSMGNLLSFNCWNFY